MNERMNEIETKARKSKQIMGKMVWKFQRKLSDSVFFSLNNRNSVNSR